MSKVADLLNQSRQAHRQAKQSQGPTQRDLFQIALDTRLEARSADPAKTDESWLVDALHPPMPGEMVRRHHRMPGLTAAEVAALKDAELERYYRIQLGQISEAMPAPVNPEIVPPKAWVVTKPGTRDDETGVLLCGSAHVFQTLTFDQRTCVTCGQMEELRPTMAVEDTEAFKQSKL